MPLRWQAWLRTGLPVLAASRRARAHFSWTRGGWRKPSFRCSRGQARVCWGVGGTTFRCRGWKSHRPRRILGWEDYSIIVARDFWSSFLRSSPCFLLFTRFAIFFFTSLRFCFRRTVSISFDRFSCIDINERFSFYRNARTRAIRSRSGRATILLLRRTDLHGIPQVLGRPFYWTFSSPRFLSSYHPSFRLGPSADLPRTPRSSIGFFFSIIKERPWPTETPWNRCQPVRESFVPSIRGACSKLVPRLRVIESSSMLQWGRNNFCAA